MKYKQNVEFVYERIRRCLELQSKKDYANAFALMDEVLSHELEPDVEAEALQFRASLKEDVGDFQAAYDDFLTALSLSQEGSYPLYVLELDLGGISEKLGRYEEAKAWYHKALEESVKGEAISGGTALKKFIEISRGAEITAQEHALCNRVAAKSWQLLQLPGEPDYSDLQGTAESLIAAGGRKGGKE